MAVLDKFKPASPASPASQARLVRMRARGEAPVGLTADPHWLAPCSAS